MDLPELEALLDPRAFIGRAPEQVEEFLDTVVAPLLEGAGDLPEARDLDV